MEGHDVGAVIVCPLFASSAYCFALGIIEPFLALDSLVLSRFETANHVFVSDKCFAFINLHLAWLFSSPLLSLRILFELLLQSVRTFALCCSHFTSAMAAHPSSSMTREAERVAEVELLKRAMAVLVRELANHPDLWWEGSSGHIGYLCTQTLAVITQASDGLSSEENFFLGQLVESTQPLLDGNEAPRTPNNARGAMVQTVEEWCLWQRLPERRRLKETAPAPAMKAMKK